MLDRATVTAFVAGLLVAGAEASTARSRQLALRRFSGWLVEEGEQPTDRLLGLRPPRLDVKVVDPLTDTQLRALIKACTGPELRDRRDEALVRLMAETALRAGEAVALTVPDVDLTAGMALVRRGKGGKGRPVPFGPQSAKALDRYLRARRTHRLAAAPDLWVGDRGKAFGYDRSPDGQQVQSLRKGTPGRYISTVYDKYRETRLRSSEAHLPRPGHVRYELSLRRPVLCDEGLCAVRDVTAGGILAPARKFFTRSGYDKEVRGVNRAMLEINLRYDELPTTDRKRLTKMIGILQMQAAGLDPSVSANTLKDHLDLARRLGLSAADFVRQGEHSLRLDFDSGGQVIGGRD